MGLAAFNAYRRKKAAEAKVATEQQEPDKKPARATKKAVEAKADENVSDQS